MHSLTSAWVVHGGGRSGPVPFADINTGRLICPLPLGGKAAQLSLDKKKNTQTGAVQTMSASASYGCLQVYSWRIGARRGGGFEGSGVFSAAAAGSLTCFFFFLCVRYSAIQKEMTREEKGGVERESEG